MAGSTISGLVTQTVDLGSPHYRSPLSITSTGTIAPAQQGANGIYGRAGLEHARIHNDGQVGGASGNGAANGGVGIDMRSALALTNAGTISGGSGGYNSMSYATFEGGNGIDLVVGGTVANSGMIVGGAGGESSYGNAIGATGGIGLDISAAATINNSGQIIGGLGGYAYHGGGTGGVAVQLSDGGTLTNTGSISGGADGQSGFFYGTGPGGIGVVLLAGGELDNTTGTITGGEGQYNGGNGGTAVQMAGGTLLNGGSIIGGTSGFAYSLHGGMARFGGNKYADMGGTGVDLSGGATLTNTGYIAGGDGYYGHFNGGNGAAGVIVTDATVIDSGSITGGVGGPGGEGYGGNGGAGVYLDGGTLIVSGTVSGGGPGSGYGQYTPHAGDAVQFGTLAGTLVIDPGAIFNGRVVAEAGAHDVLVLAAGATGGTLSGLGHDFTGFNTLTVDTGADWTLTGTNTLRSAGVLSIGGTLNVAGTLSDPGRVHVQKGGTLGVSGTGALLLSGQAGLNGGVLEGAAQGTLVIGATLAGAAAGVITVEAGAALSGAGAIAGAPVADGGMITAFGGALTIEDAVSGSGTLAIASGAKLDAASSVSGVAVTFAANATLQLGTPTSLTSTLSGFGSGDVIDLQHLSANGLSFAAGTLTVSQGNTTVDQIAFAGSYTTANFALGTNGHGGTDISFVAHEATSDHADFAGLLGHVILQASAAEQDSIGGAWRTDPIGRLDGLAWNLLHYGH